MIALNGFADCPMSALKGADERFFGQCELRHTAELAVSLLGEPVGS
jgi:hypothetical protein